MAGESADWTAWAIGALGAMALALVGMGKFIASIFTTRIAQLEKELKDYVLFANNRAKDMQDAHKECEQKYHETEIRLALLEGKPPKRTKHETKIEHTKTDEMEIS